MRNSISDLDLLENKVVDLVDYCNQLKAEITKLKEMLENAEAERSRLESQNANAKNEVREAIEKLQSLSSRVPTNERNLKGMLSD